MNDTIERLKARILNYPPLACETNLTTAPPHPVTLGDYERFEYESGIILPTFLRRVYTEVADGGFGPAYGINCLQGDNTDSIANWDRVFQNANRDEPDGPQWPTHLIRFCEIGCNMFYAIDIDVEECTVFRVEATKSDDIRDWLTVVSASAVTWLHAWADEPVPTSRYTNGG